MTPIPQSLFFNDSQFLSKRKSSKKISFNKDKGDGDNKSGTNKKGVNNYNFRWFCKPLLEGLSIEELNLIQEKASELNDSEIIKMFKKYKNEKNKIKENFWFLVALNKISKLYSKVNKTFKSKYPGYFEELRSQFFYQILRRLADYGISEKRGKKIRNGDMQNSKNKINFYSIAFSLLKVTHEQVIYELNEKKIKIKTLRKKFKNENIENPGDSYLLHSSDLLTKNDEGKNMEFEFKDKNGIKDYYVLNIIKDEVNNYFDSYDKKYIFYKKIIKKGKDNISREELINQEISKYPSYFEDLENGNINKNLLKMIKEIKVKRKKSYEKIKKYLYADYKPF